MLATTALEESWGEADPLLYLGEWCRLYDRRSVWQQRAHELVPYHWSDRHKLQRDHAYLSELHDRLLPQIAQALNRYHGGRNSDEYWHMLLGAWLPTYVAVLFDRWECLRSAFSVRRELTTIALSFAGEGTVAFDYTDFVTRSALSPEWNHRLYLRIIRHAYADQCEIRVQRARASAPPATSTGSSWSLSNAAKRAFGGLLTQLDTLLGSVFTRVPVTFVASYFSMGALVRINLALGQVPRLHVKDFEWPIAGLAEDLPLQDRTALELQCPTNNPFEAFLVRELPRDLPRVYVEGYARLRERARTIRLSTKVICSANAHWGNEIFKLWCAEQVAAGARFVSLTHGGALPPLFDEVMSFEERVSVSKTTWAQPYHPKHVRLPVNKVMPRNVRSSRRYCAAIGQEIPLFPYRATTGPIAGDVVETVAMVCELYSHLNADIQRDFRVKPYSNQGWNTRQRFADVLGAEKVFPPISYKRCLAEARVVVCTYPETTFAEAMASGIPTIMLYEPRLWERVTAMDFVLARLRDAAIVFDDPALAAAHLNRIWSDPLSWWDDATTVAAREQFFASCLYLDNAWWVEWRHFLQRMAA